MEYLIKREDGNWFSLGPDKYESTLTPSSIAWTRINGQGDFRIKCADGEVSFSYEEPGLLVSFESTAFTEERCNKILEEILSKITSKTGEEGYIVPYNNLFNRTQTRWLSLRDCSHQVCAV